MIILALGRLGQEDCVLQLGLHSKTLSFLKQTNTNRGMTGVESRVLDPGCVIKVWPLRFDEGLHVGWKVV